MADAVNRFIAKLQPIVREAGEAGEVAQRTGEEIRAWRSAVRRPKRQPASAR